MLEKDLTDAQVLCALYNHGRVQGGMISVKRAT